MEQSSGKISREMHVLSQLRALYNEELRRDIVIPSLKRALLQGMEERKYIEVELNVDLPDEVEHSPPPTSLRGVHHAYISIDQLISKESPEQKQVKEVDLFSCEEWEIDNSSIANIYILYTHVDKNQIDTHSFGTVDIVITETR